MESIHSNLSNQSSTWSDGNRSTSSVNSRLSSLSAATVTDRDFIFAVVYGGTLGATAVTPTTARRHGQLRSDRVSSSARSIDVSRKQTTTTSRGNGYGRIAKPDNAKYSCPTTAAKRRKLYIWRFAWNFTTAVSYGDTWRLFG